MGERGENGEQGTPALRRGAGATGEPPVLLGRGEGVGLGIEPSQTLSYIGNGVVPGQGEHSLYYAIQGISQRNE